MSFEKVLNSPQIQLVPGSGFSALELLKIICKAWNPSGGRAEKVHEVMCTYLAGALNGVSDPQKRAAFCEAISGEGFDDEINEILADAISYAVAEVLGTIGDAAGLAGADCAVTCHGGGASVDVGNLVQQVVEIAVSSYGGDGVDWAGLASEVGQVALTNAACCVVSLAADLSTRAVVAKQIRPLSKILGQFRDACRDLVAADEASGGSRPGQPGWGDDTDVSSQQGGLTIDPKVVTLVYQPTMKILPIDEDGAPKPKPESTPGEGKNWLPLALTITGVGVASILMVRRRPRR